MAILFFLFIFVTILYLAHFVFYDFLIRFFSIDSFYLKRVIIVAMILMPILFVTAMISIYFNGSIFTRTLYFITGLWHGVLVNFLVVIFASWFFVGVLKILKTSPSSLTFLVIGLVGVVVAIALSVYGVYNVFDIKVREVSFAPRNLPELWRGKKAIHISDVHLGSILRDGYMQKIVKKIDKIKPDIIFITGDLFDSIDGSVEYFHESLKSLGAPQGVFFVTGNHETYLGLEKMNKTLEGTNITILDNNLVEIDGLQIIGLAYPERMAKKNIVEDLNKIDNFDPQKINILLYHEPRFIEKIKKTGVDLMLAGHTHKGQMWPFNFITESIFKGYDYGFFKEGSFNLNVSSGIGVWGPTMRTSGKNEVVVINFK